MKLVIAGALVIGCGVSLQLWEFSGLPALVTYPLALLMGVLFAATLMALYDG